MTLRVIHIFIEDGEQVVFAFLLTEPLPDGVTLEYAQPGPVLDWRREYVETEAVVN